MELGDEAVMATNDDATEAKLSTVSKGYYTDSFLPFFSKSGGHPAFRPPMLNRGTFVRVALIQGLVRQFLEGVAERIGADNAVAAQIVSFGAGFDTLPFHLLSSATHCPAMYLETDLAEVVLRKISALRRRRGLAAALERGGAAADVRFSPKALTAPRYHLAASDLREPATVSALLAAAGLRPELPTLFLSELAFVYVPAESTFAILSAIAADFTAAAAVVYEQIEPSDPFGAMMLRNIEARGCPLLSVRSYPTLAAQRARFTAAGWTTADAKTMLAVHDELLSPAERARASALEALDEWEEWALLLAHYCVVIAEKGQAAFTWPQEVTATLSR